MVKKATIFVLFLFFFFHLLKAQEPFSVQIDKNKGLPSDNVYDVFQDSRGFIWIAHDDGLSRYDGSGFKNFNSPQQSSKGGSSIKEDAFGRIWYENFDGYYFYVENDSLKSLSGVNAVGYSRYGLFDNHLYTIQRGGVYIYSLYNLRLTKKIALNLTNVVSSECTNKNFYLIMDSIYKIDSTGIIHSIKNYSSSLLKYPGTAVLAKKEIILYDRNNRTKACYQVSNHSVYKKFNLPFEGFIQTESYCDSSYWFCTSNGVYAFNEWGKSLNKGKPFFKGKSISRVIKDREGNFWFGTTNSGLFLVPDLNTRVYDYGFEISRLARREKEIVAGTKSGQIYIIGADDVKPRLLFDNQVNKEILFMQYDSVGQQILSTSNRFISLNHDGKIVWDSDVSIKSCCRINQNYLAFNATGVGGILTIDKTVDIRKSPCFVNTGQPSGSLEISHLLDGVRGKSTAYNAHTGTIYYSVNTGLYAIRNCKKKEVLLNRQPVYISKFQQNDTCILGLSTNGALYRVLNNDSLQELEILKNNQDLKCNDFKFCSGYLLLSTNLGLMYSKPNELLKRLVPGGINYAVNGIYDMEIVSGNLTIATSKGLVKTSLDKLYWRSSAPGFIINSIKANGNLIKNNSRVKYNENSIEINYSVLHFRNLLGDNVFYRINGGEWMATSQGTRTLRLAALSPGEYNLEFTIGSETATKEKRWGILFIIGQPWWLTWWAIAIFCMVALIIFVFIYRWQTRVLRQQNQLLTQKVELEKNLRQSILKSIKAQMNPHFFYNALNTIQSFIFTDDKRSASTYLSKFSKLTRTILEMSEKDEVSLAEEMEALKLYLDIEKVRFDNDFNFELIKSPDINPELIRIPSMLIQPYVENAIRHGLLHKKGEKQLLVKFQRDTTLLTVLVSDNGIGRLRSNEINRIKQGRHNSFATKANHTRLSILNKDAERVGVEFVDKKDELGNSMGTDVIIRMPLSND